MTILYSNLQALTVFKADEQQGYAYSQIPITTPDQLLTIIQDHWKPVDNTASAAKVPLPELQTLASCFAKASENLVWQLRVIKEDNLALHHRQPSLEQELLFLYTQLENIQQELTTLIDEQTITRLKELTIPMVSSVSQKLKINLGSGEYPIPGWINIDMAGSDLPYNVLWDLPFQDGSVDFVYSSYLLEHLNYQHDAPQLLQEIKRVLKPGGIFRVAVPHIRPFLQAYLNQDHAFFDQVEAKWGFSFGGTLLEKALNYAGVGHRAGVIDDHKFGYDDSTFSQLLRSAGFIDVYPCAYMNSGNPDLQIDLEPLLAESYQNVALSLIYECVK